MNHNIIHFKGKLMHRNQHRTLTFFYFKRYFVYQLIFMIESQIIKNFIQNIALSCITYALLTSLFLFIEK